MEGREKVSVLQAFDAWTGFRTFPPSQEQLDHCDENTRKLLKVKVSLLFF